MKQLLTSVAICSIVNTVNGWSGECESKYPEDRERCGAIGDPVECSNTSGCDWSIDEEWNQRKAELEGGHKKKKKKVRFKLPSISLSRSKDVKKHKYTFKNGDIFWVWINTPSLSKSKSLPILSKLRKSSSKKKTKKSTPPPPINLNTLCEWLEYKDDRLICGYDETFHGNHKNEYKDAIISVSTSELVKHSLGSGFIHGVQNIEFRIQIGKRKTVKLRRLIYIRKIKNVANSIKYVIFDDEAEAPYGVHQALYTNFEKLIRLHDHNINLWNLEYIFNRVYVIPESKVNFDEWIDNPPKGLIWLSRAVKKTKDVCYANLGQDLKDPIIEAMRYKDPTRTNLHDDPLVLNVYNQYWSIWSENLNRYFIDNLALNEKEIVATHSENIANMLGSKLATNIGLDWWQPVVKHFFVEIVPGVESVRYQWDYVGKKPWDPASGYTGSAHHGIYHYTLTMDGNVNLYVFAIEHGHSESFAKALMAGLKDIDIIMVEHDYFRMFKQFEQMLEKTQQQFALCKTENSDNEELCRKKMKEALETGDPSNPATKYLFEIMKGKDPYRMDKTIPLLISRRKDIPYILADSPTRMVYPWFLVQNWPDSDVRVDRAASNGALAIVYRGIWLTVRNEFMVNTINNAVDKYYAKESVKKNIKLNYAIIIGAQHRTPELGSEKYRLAYKMGMHSILTNNIFAVKDLVDKNGKISFIVPPYTKQFGVDLKHFTAHVYDNNDNIYNGYDDDNMYDGSHQEYLYGNKVEYDDDIFIFTLLTSVILNCLFCCIISALIVGFGGSIFYYLFIQNMYLDKGNDADSEQQV